MRLVRAAAVALLAVIALGVGVLVGLALDDDGSGGRVAVAELTCGSGWTADQCDAHRLDVVAQHCAQDDVGAVRLTTYYTQFRGPLGEGENVPAGQSTAEVDC